MQPPAQDQNTVLLSKTAAAQRKDLLELPRNTTTPRAAVLSGGNEAAEHNAGASFFSLLAQPQTWNGVSAILIGASLETGFDACLLEALAVAASRSAGRGIKIYRAGNSAPLWQSPHVSQEGLALGNWLADEASSADGKESDLSISELEYVFGSGGYRASALIAMLRANYGGRLFRDVVDLGAGIGFLSYMLAQKSEFGVQRTVMVEPQAKRISQGERLWMHHRTRADETFAFVRTTTQNFSPHGPTDLAIICQSLFYIPADGIADVIRREWHALRPGGLFIVNEHLIDEPGEATQKRATQPVLERKRLIALLADCAAPKVYLRRDGWACAHDPAAISAREFSTDSFLVLEKPQTPS